MGEGIPLGSGESHSENESSENEDDKSKVENLILISTLNSKNSWYKWSLKKSKTWLAFKIPVGAIFLSRIIFPLPDHNYCCSDEELAVADKWLFFFV